MGGIGSGRKRTVHQGVVEDALALDIRILRRLGVARSGECVIDTLRWSIGGLEAPSVRLRIDLSDIDRCDMRIDGDMLDEIVHQHITIDAVPSGFGGHRHYFICPVAGTRCEVLSYVDGRFASRRAHGLAYASQSQDDLGRAHRRMAKVECRLNGSTVLRNPRGAHRRQLVENLHNTQYEIRTIRNERLRKMLGGRSGTRQIPNPRF